MAGGKFKRNLPPLKGPCGLLQGTWPRECAPHGEPTKEGEPEYCLDCDRAIKGTGFPCFRHATPIQLETAKRGGAPPPKELPPLAERLHGSKEKRKPKRKTMLSPATIKKIGTAVKSGLSIHDAVETCKADVLTDCETHQRKTGAMGLGTVNWPSILQFFITLLTDLAPLLVPAVPVTPPPPTPPLP